MFFFLLRAYPSLCLSLGEQHCRALAFQDLHRVASSASSDKASKARRARLFRGGVPSVVFACCAVIHAAALQVRAFEDDTFSLEIIILFYPG